MSLKRRDLIVSLIKDTLYNSTAMAILKLFQASTRGIIKCLWIACLLGTCSLCAYFVIEALIEFFKYEVTTNARTYFEMTSLFPKITYCNKNPFTTKYAYDTAGAMTLDNFVYHINSKLSDAEKKKLHHRLEDILIDCTFNTQKCSYKDFKEEYDKNLGLSLLLF